MKNSSRILALFLVLCMVLSALPAVFAAEPTTATISVASTKRDGAEIPTYVTLPADYNAEATYELVVLIHGHGGNHNEWGGYDAISNGLAAEGMIAVTLDFPGCGNSTESFRLNTMTNMKNDVLDVINYMKATYNIDGVDAMGYSMGGRIVLEMIAEDMVTFDKIEFVAPAEDTEDLKNLFGGSENWELLKATANENGYAPFTTIYGQNQELSKEWFADLEKYSDGLAEAAAEKFTGEAMVLYATDDAAVSPSVSQGVADAFGCPVLNTYAEGHSYSFYGTDPVVISTVNEGTVNFFTGEPVTYVYKMLLTESNNTTKYGHIDLDVSAAAFLQNFAYGDVTTVAVNDHTFAVPVCSDYTDVATGAKLFRAASGKSVTTLAINYGQIAVETGLAVAAESGYTYAEGVTDPVYIYVTMKEEGGYLAQWQAHHLVRTDVREDYPNLTDAEFANFREVTTTGIASATLYRSSSPVNPELGRNTYADAAAKAAGIQTFVNLADTKEDAEAYEGYSDSYYSTQNIIFLGLPVAFTSDAFKTGLAEGYRFIANNEGPYLIHCTEGKDRAGMANAILECLMGASYREVIADYMTTYYNYYGVTEDEARYQVVVDDNIVANLTLMFDVEDLKTADLQAEAEAYLKEIGLTEAEIAAIKANLGLKNPFTDVKESDWFYAYVVDMTDQGVIRGMTETTFEPDATLTRGQWATLLYRIAGEPEVTEASTFTDVPKGSYYADAIAWAQDEGVVNGATATTFEPEAPVTREQIVTMLCRYVGGKYGTGDLTKYTDSGDISDYAVEAMKWAVGAGYINGMTADTLVPKGLSTRAQAAKLLSLLVEKSTEISMQSYCSSTEYEWFSTGKTEYTVKGKMVSASTEVYNFFEDVYYTAEPNGIDVILEGTCGEQWVSKLSKVIKTYTKLDGSPLTADDFTPDTFVEMKTIASGSSNFAMFIPIDTKVSVQTAWGDVLHANREGVPHGAGDYLVCRAGADGKPDLSDVWVVNGVLFQTTYDTTNAPE
ncbi:MAG: alpha/beta fold hydrolase [Faecousia sp.]